MDSMLPHSDSEGRSGLLLFLPDEKQMLRRTRSREAKAAEWGWNILNRFPPSTGAACYFNLTAGCRRSLLFEMYLLSLFVSFH